MYTYIFNHFYTMRPDSTKLDKITQNKGHYAVQGHSSQFWYQSIRKLMCDFLLVINTNLPPILHRFREIAVDRSKIAI